MESQKSLLANIKEDILVLIRGEIELAKADLVPAGKNLGKGAGLLAVAAYFGFTFLFLSYLALSALLAWLFAELFQWDIFPATACGIGVMTLIMAIMAIIFVAIASQKFKRIESPQSAIAEGQETLTQVSAAISKGIAEVESGEVLSRHQEAMELKANARRSANQQPKDNGWHKLMD